MGLEGAIRDYRGIEGTRVARGKLEGTKWGYIGLDWARRCKRGLKGFRGVRGDYRGLEWARGELEGIHGIFYVNKFHLWFVGTCIIIIIIIILRVQWTMHLGSSHMHVHAVTRVHAVTPKLVICIMYLTSI